MMKVQIGKITEFTELRVEVSLGKGFSIAPSEDENTFCLLASDTTVIRVPKDRYLFVREIENEA